jgi:hypothetical protein
VLAAFFDVVSFAVFFFDHGINLFKIFFEDAFVGISSSDSAERSDACLRISLVDPRGFDSGNILFPTLPSWFDATLLPPGDLSAKSITGLFSEAVLAFFQGIDKLGVEAAFFAGILSFDSSVPTDGCMESKDPFDEVRPILQLPRFEAALKILAARD